MHLLKMCIGSLFVVSQLYRWIFYLRHSCSSVKRNKEVDKKKDSFPPAHPLFAGALLRWGTLESKRKVSKRSGVQPFEQSERSGVWVPAPLSGSKGTILIWRNRRHVVSLRLAIAHLMSPSDKFIRHPKVNMPRSAFTTLPIAGNSWIEPQISANRHRNHSTDSAVWFKYGCLAGEVTPLGRGEGSSL